MLLVAGALALHHDVDAVIAQDLLQQADIGEARHVLEHQRVVGEHAGDHQRQGGILGAGNRNRAVQRPAADNANAVHETPRAAACGRLPAFLVAGNSGGIVRFCRFRRFHRVFRAPTRLRLAALEVFPQRRLKAFFAQLFFRFRPLRHAG
jgi:hypothetical protein